jgi:hypothetical protein
MHNLLDGFTFDYALSGLNLCTFSIAFSMVLALTEIINLLILEKRIPDNNKMAVTVNYDVKQCWK